MAVEPFSRGPGGADGWYALGVCFSHVAAPHCIRRVQEGTVSHLLLVAGWKVDGRRMEGWMDVWVAGDDWVAGHDDWVPGRVGDWVARVQETPVQHMMSST